MHSEPCLLVKTAPEISLKSAPVRALFMRRLAVNVKDALCNRGIEGIKIAKTGGRLFLSGKSPGNAQKALSNAQKELSFVFGIHSTALCSFYKAETLDDISDAAADCFAQPMAKAGKGVSFAVRANRVGKQGFSSKDIEIMVGSRLLKDVPNSKVNLTKPEFTASIEVRDSDTYCYVSEAQCLGGLPIGVEGRIGFIFSGKKHEAVAALLLMKRGCTIVPVAGREGKAAKANIKKLIRFNSGREFKTITESELGSAVSGRRILALGSADDALDAQSAAQGNALGGAQDGAQGNACGFAERDSAYSVPVLRPLLLYPQEMLAEKEKLVGLVGLAGFAGLVGE